MVGVNTTWEAWWPDLYTSAGVPQEYPGGSESYKLAGEFLGGENLVEEWGCATTYGRQFIPAPYRGVDGAKSKFNDVTADLTQYKSDVPNALIRHVLEHNWEWRTILDNFLGSFTNRAVVILFIPLGDQDINRSFENRVEMPQSPPGLQLDQASFFDRIYGPGLRVRKDRVLKNETPPFGYERLFFLEKVPDQTVYVDSPPVCKNNCGKAGEEQLHVETEMLGQRYQIALNYCADCLSEVKDGLYGLKRTLRFNFE